jgi:hypothetical protein
MVSQEGPEARDSQAYAQPDGMVGSAGGSHLAVGEDSLPIVAYQFRCTGSELRILHCVDPSCDALLDPEDYPLPRPSLFEPRFARSVTI